MKLQELQEKIREAAASGRPLRLRGGGSKDFYGGALAGEVLDCRSHAGIVDYEPTELVVTARCGTLLADLEKTLAGNNQFLPFEPPHFGPEATLGGCIAAGLSGPRRASAGSLRDFVLGARIVDGRGRDLAFGGQVMKNVAGYDVSRLIAGSLGTLGLILEVSLKVLPRPVVEQSLGFKLDEAAALEAMQRWAGSALPVSATAWRDGQLRVRLSGAASAVRAAAAQMKGEARDVGDFWERVREQSDAFFAGPEPLWRLSLPATAAPTGLPGRQMIEWGGALRWLKSTAPAAEVRVTAERLGGHATLFRGDKAAGAFAPLSPVLARLHRELKQAFDPAGILNPGRLYPEF